MRKVDYHLHSYFSADSEENPRNQVLEAIKYGLEEICFTEHHEFHFPGLSFDLDVSSYFDEIQSLQKEFRGKIKIKKGLEIGLDSRFKEEIDLFVKEHDFDFIIGSIHEIDDVEVYEDTSYYKNKSKITAHREYFEHLLECIDTFTCFDSLGHLDYVARYGPYRDKMIDYDKFEMIIHQIIKKLVERDKGIEVNTRLFQFSKAKIFYQYLLTEYAKAGGKIVTLGTDNHKANRTFDRITEAQHLIQSTGFSDISTFSQRRLDK